MQKEHDQLNNKQYLLLYFFIALVAYLYYCSKVFLVQLDFNFSFSIIVISILWLAFNLTTALSNYKTLSMPSISAVFGIVLCMIVAMLLYVIQLTTLLQLTMLACLWFILSACLGKKIANHALNPILLLLAITPLANSIILYDANSVHNLLSGITELPEYHINTKGKIAELNSLDYLLNKQTSSLIYINIVYIVCFIYSAMILKSQKLRVGYVILSILFVLVFDILRIAGTIMYSHNFEYTNSEFSPDNASYLRVLYISWALYFILLALIILLGLKLKKIDKTKDNTQNNVGSYSLFTNSMLYFNTNAVLFVNLTALFALLTSFNYLKDAYFNFTHSISQTSDLRVSNLGSGWVTCFDCYNVNWQPTAGYPEANLLMSYKNKELTKSVDLFLAYYNHSHGDNSLSCFKSKYLYGKTWLPSEISEKNLHINKKKTYSDKFQNFTTSKLLVNQIILQGSHTNRVIWYWYWVDGETTSYMYYAKVLGLLDILNSVRSHFAIIAVSSEYTNEYDLISAQATMYKFINDNYYNLYPDTRRIALVV